MCENNKLNALSIIGAAYESDDNDDENLNVPSEECRLNQRDDHEIEQSVKMALDLVVNRVSIDVPFANFKNFSISRSVKDDTEIDISSSSSSSTSSWSLSSDDNEIVMSDDDDDNDDKSNKNNKTFKRKQDVKTKGELSIDDLPPIEQLTIRVETEQLSQIGRVVSIIDQLVIVQSFKSLPALDLESVLFFKDGSSFGSIFDVLGPVIEPRYAIRFNDNEEIQNKAIHIDMPVYYAASCEKPITSYVFAEQLRRMKGSDASWKHNNEPPEEVREYSDDEEERRDKQKFRAKNRQRPTQREHQSPRNRHWRRRGTFTSPSGIRVPPNTPNWHHHQNNSFNHHQLFPQQNWFAHSYYHQSQWNNQ